MACYRQVEGGSSNLLAEGVGFLCGRSGWISCSTDRDHIGLGGSFHSYSVPMTPRYSARGSPTPVSATATPDGPCAQPISVSGWWKQKTFRLRGSGSSAFV